MTISIMPRPERAERLAYGENKRPKQFMLTDTSSNQLEQVAEELRTTRSEVLERMIRCGGLEAAKRFNTETGTCENT